MTFLTFLRDNAPFLAAGVLLTFLSSFGQTFFISIFAGEIREAFGLSNGGWGSIYALGTFASAMVMVWSGILTDHFRVRALGVVVLCALATACLIMATLPSVWLLPVAIFLLRLAGQGMATHIAVVAMARWFRATRGRALSIAVMGVSLGEAFLPLIFVGLMEDLSWRTLWVIAACVVLAMTPILVMLLRLERTPQSVAADSASEGMDGAHWTRGQMLRNRLFWLLIPSLLAPPAFSTAFFFQQVHFAEVKGWDHATLVALFPVFSAAAVLSMLTSGWLIDRIGTARLMPVFQLPFVAGFLILSVAPEPWIAAVAMAMMGAAQGANSTVPNAFWAEFYGTRYLGAIKSLATAVMVLGTAIGPILTGLLIDLGVPFTAQMPGIAIYFLAAAALVAMGVSAAAPRLPRPAEIDVVRP